MYVRYAFIRNIRIGTCVRKQNPMKKMSTIPACFEAFDVAHIKWSTHTHDMCYVYASLSTSEFIRSVYQYVRAWADVIKAKSKQCLLCQMAEMATMCRIIKRHSIWQNEWQQTKRSKINAEQWPCVRVSVMNEIKKLKEKIPLKKQQIYFSMEFHRWAESTPSPFANHRASLQPPRLNHSIYALTFLNKDWHLI